MTTATVLLVDDQEENLSSIALFLANRAREWRVLQAKSVADAIGALTANNVDLVVTDLRMETETAGLDVVAAARKKDPLAMVLLVTAYDRTIDRYKAYELGAFDCIAKNSAGIDAAEEILVKAKAALGFQSLAREHAAAQARVDTLNRYFDKRLLEIIERRPELLELHAATLSVCFWDIRGFSRLSELLRHKPDLIAGFLREYFKAGSDVMYAHEGIVDKFIGDGIMGLFGVIPSGDDEGRGIAKDAILAAFDLRDAFRRLLKDWLARWKFHTTQAIDIGLGCGIHTGEVLVGRVESAGREQFTALGSVVNFAARLEARAKGGEILVSGTTEARIAGLFEVESVGTISDVKNIPGDHVVFRVVGPSKA